LRDGNFLENGEHVQDVLMQRRHVPFIEAYSDIFKEKPEETPETIDDTMDCPTGIKGINPDRIMSLAKKGPVRAIGAPKTSQQELLFIIAAPFTGSTALLSLIATSPQVSNLCSSHAWACEGSDILRSAHLMTWETRWQEDKPSNWSKALQVYMQYWNTSKTILVDKSPPNVIKMQRIDSQLRQTGVIPKFVVLTKNPCSLSEEYLPRFFDPMIEAVQTLSSEQVLRIKYEDMVREPHYVAKALLSFMPSLKSLDPAVCGICGVGDGVAWAGRNLSLVEYSTSHGDFDFSFYAVSSAWKTYMKAFGYT